MASQADDDLVASKTEGYKPGEKKTIDEYAKLGMWETKPSLSFHALFEFLHMCRMKISLAVLLNFTKVRKKKNRSLAAESLGLKLTSQS